MSVGPIRARVYQIGVTVKQEKDISSERRTSYLILGSDVPDALSMVQFQDSDLVEISVRKVGDDVYVSPGVARLIREQVAES